MNTYDLIILGCGGIGSAAFYNANQAGLKTLCIDQYELLHPHGGTHGETRAFRKAYYDDPNYIPILKKAYLEWKKLNNISTTKIFEEHGVLEIGLPDSTMVKDAVACSEKYNIPIQILTKKEMNSRYPDFYIPDEMIGIFQAQAGFLYIDNCIKQFIKTEPSSNSKVVTNEKVISWEVDKDQTIHIKTNKQKYTSKYLIIAAGVWTKEILNSLNLPITILQKKLFWTDVKNNSYSSKNNSPCFAYHLPEGIFYGFPAVSDYIKVARHTGGLKLATPEENSTTTENEELDSIQKFVHQYLTKANLTKTKQASCLYDNTPDKQFILDHHPDHPQIAFIAGLSGHGYKMCNVLGEILVDLVTKNKTEFDISFLSLKRF